MGVSRFWSLFGYSVLLIVLNCWYVKPGPRLSLSRSKHPCADSRQFSENICKIPPFTSKLTTIGRGISELDENELYEEWWNTPEDQRPDVERRLFAAVRPHAQAVLWEKLGENNPDLTHDIVVAVVNQLADFRRECKFSTWVHEIASRKADEELRKRMRRRKVFDETKEVLDERHAEEGEVANAVYPSETPDFDSPIEFDQLCAKLPQEDAALLRYKNEGLSSEEIAAKMGIGQEAVDSRWARLKSKVRKKN